MSQKSVHYVVVTAAAVTHTPLLKLFFLLHDFLGFLITASSSFLDYSQIWMFVNIVIWDKCNCYKKHSIIKW